MESLLMRSVITEPEILSGQILFTQTTAQNFVVDAGIRYISFALVGSGGYGGRGKIVGSTTFPGVQGGTTGVSGALMYVNELLVNYGDILRYEPRNANASLGTSKLYLNDLLIAEVEKGDVGATGKSSSSDPRPLPENSKSFFHNDGLTFGSFQLYEGTVVSPSNYRGANIKRGSMLGLNNTTEYSTFTGNFGWGGPGTDTVTQDSGVTPQSGGIGGQGALRIIWGEGRLFPSTNTVDV